MRKSEQEISDRAEIDSVIRRSQVCRLGLSDQGQPYIVPLCFGYDGEALYFHCAKEGRKLEILSRNNKVCFEFDLFEGLIEAEQGCKFGIRYQSVIGFGIAHRIEDAAEQQKVLTVLMAQYVPGQTFSFPPEAVNRTAIFKIVIESLTGKQSKR